MPCRPKDRGCEPSNITRGPGRDAFARRVRPPSAPASRLDHRGGAGRGAGPSRSRGAVTEHPGVGLGGRAPGWGANPDDHAPVLACVNDPALRRALGAWQRAWEAGGEEGGPPVVFASGADVVQACRARAHRALLIESGTRQEGSSAAIIRGVRAHARHLPIVACVAAHAGVSGVIVRLTRAGATAVALAPVDDAVELVRQLAADACGTRSRAAVCRRMRADAPPELRPVLDALFEAMPSGANVEGLARLVGVTRRTLLNRFAGAGWPGPSETLAWGRLLVVAHLHAAGGSPTAAARAAGVAATPALRALARRLTGSRLAEVQAAHWATLYATFRRHLPGAA